MANKEQQRIYDQLLNLILASSFEEAKQFLKKISKIDCEAILNLYDANGQTLLIHAVQAKSASLVKELIWRGASVDVATKDETSPEHGWKPLIWAIESCHIDVINILMHYKSAEQLTETIPKCKRLPIHLAARYGLLDVVKSMINEEPKLLNVKDGNKQTPLKWAVRQAHVEVVEFLIKQEALLNSILTLDIEGTKEFLTPRLYARAMKVHFHAYPEVAEKYKKIEELLEKGGAKDIAISALELFKLINLLINTIKGGRVDAVLSAEDYKKTYRLAQMQAWIYTNREQKFMIIRDVQLSIVSTLQKICVSNTATTHFALFKRKNRVLEVLNTWCNFHCPDLLVLPQPFNNDVEFQEHCYTEHYGFNPSLPSSTPKGLFGSWHAEASLQELLGGDYPESLPMQRMYHASTTKVHDLGLFKTAVTTKYTNTGAVASVDLTLSV